MNTTMTQGSRQSPPVRLLFAAVLLFATVTPFVSGRVFAQDLFPEYDLLMYKDPDISNKVDVTSTFPEGLVELWQRAKL